MNENQETNYLTDPLWIKLSAFQFDDPEAIYPFSAKLATEEKWTRDFALEVIDEYRKFLYLCCINPSGASPSLKVDAAWHMHLTYTRNYWQLLCKETLGREIHHNPSTGGSSQKTKYTDLYSDTWLQYKQVFGQEPPDTIWEQPTAKSVGGNIQSVINYLQGFKFYLPLLLPIIFSGIVFNRFNPFQLNGPLFLVFYGLLMIASIFLMAKGRERRRMQLVPKLNAILPETDKYDLAFIAGGRNKVVLLCFADLVERGLIKNTRDSFFEVEPDLVQAQNNPAIKYMEELSVNTQYTFRQLEKYLEKVAIDKWDKLGYLVAEYNETDSVSMAPVVTLIVGGLRVLQGATNDKPLGILIAMMVAFAIIYQMLRKAADFHIVAASVLDSETVKQKAPDSTYSADIVLSGIDGMIGLLNWEVLENIRAVIIPPQFSDSSQGCSSSGCGSSCGSGCGGCGGD